MHFTSPPTAFRTQTAESLMVGCEPSSCHGGITYTWLTPSHTTQHRCHLPLFWKDTPSFSDLWPGLSSLYSSLLQLRLPQGSLQCISKARLGQDWEKKTSHLWFLYIELRPSGAAKSNFLVQFLVSPIVRQQVARNLKNQSILEGEKSITPFFVGFFFFCFCDYFLRHLAIDLLHFFYNFVVLKEMTLLRSNKWLIKIHTEVFILSSYQYFTQYIFAN